MLAQLVFTIRMVFGTCYHIVINIDLLQLYQLLLQFAISSGVQVAATTWRLGIRLHTLQGVTITLATVATIRDLIRGTGCCCVFVCIHYKLLPQLGHLASIRVIIMG